jgi:hypothetical protein
MYLLRQSPGDYEQKSTLKISGTLDSPVKSSIPASPNSCLGGTGERSHPVQYLCLRKGTAESILVWFHVVFGRIAQMGRMSLYNPKWMPVPTFSNVPNTAPGCYDKAAPASFGKQTVSSKQTSAAISFPSEDRDTVRA